MPSFDIVKEVKPLNTFRVSNIVSNFDLDLNHVNEHFKGNIDIEDKEWNVGLIVGGVRYRKKHNSKRVLP